MADKFQILIDEVIKSCEGIYNSESGESRTEIRRELQSWRNAIRSLYWLINVKPTDDLKTKYYFGTATNFTKQGMPLNGRGIDLSLLTSLSSFDKEAVKRTSEDFDILAEKEEKKKLADQRAVDEGRIEKGSNFSANQEIFIIMQILGELYFIVSGQCPPYRMNYSEESHEILAMQAGVEALKEKISRIKTDTKKKEELTILTKSVEDLENNWKNLMGKPKGPFRSFAKPLWKRIGIAESFDNTLKRWSEDKGRDGEGDGYPMSTFIRRVIAPKFPDLNINKK